MLTKRQKDIITILQRENDWLKGSVIAGKISVTSRTVRNDIKSIKYEQKTLIESSPYGYRLTPGAALPPDFYKNDKFAGKEERINYVLGKLLTIEAELDLYDLEEDLYVSLQTLEKDVRRMELILKEFNLTLNKKANLISAIGSEHDKRRLLSHLVYNELNEKFHDLVTYRQYFEDVELYTIKTILYEVMSENKISANEYSINAIVLHLGIAISRVKSQKLINKEDYESMPLEEYKVFELAKKIAEQLSIWMKVILPKEEVYYLAYILIGKTKPHYSALTAANLHELIDDYYIELVRELMDSINHTYGLHLYEEEIFIKLVIHVRDLIIRAKNHMFTKNPLKDSIKSTYPLIYDIGCYIADQLFIKTGILIKEDEIAYLAIHVGACLETNQTKSGIKTLLLCPQYYNIHNAIAGGIMKKMQDSLIITDTDYRLRAAHFYRDFDFILTTMDIAIEPDIYDGEILTINPFPTEDDYKRIEHAVKQIRNRERSQNFAVMTRKSFRKELFLRRKNCNDEWEAIEILCGRMTEASCVKEGFLADVITRERLSATTFGSRFSIPHSIAMDANITSISVMITDEAFPWGNFTVSLVLLIAIKQEDHRQFAGFYEALIGLLMKDGNLDSFCKAKNYEDFICRIEQALSRIE